MSQARGERRDYSIPALQKDCASILEAIDDLQEHLPEGKYIELMNSIQNIHQYLSWQPQQPRSYAEARATFGGARPVPAPAPAPPANTLTTTVLNAIFDAVAPARPRPAVAPAPAPAVAPTRPTRRQRRDMYLLRLPNDTELLLTGTTPAVIGRYNATTHSIYETGGATYNSPSGWATGHGIHCNGWDRVRIITRNPTNPAIIIQGLTLGQHYDSNHD